MRRAIYIPHLGFSVFVVPRPKNWKSYASTLFSKDGYSVKLVLPDNITKPALAHELIHVLQAICERYRIDFIREDEHMGYLMQWLMQEILTKRKPKKRKVKRVH